MNHERITKSIENETKLVNVESKEQTMYQREKCGATTRNCNLFKITLPTKPSIPSVSNSTASLSTKTILLYAILSTILALCYFPISVNAEENATIQPLPL
jgi:hypothetical protein